MLSSQKYITTVPFSGLFNWSVQYLNETKIAFNTAYPMIRIGEFLTRNKTQIVIQDKTTYKRATIKVRNGGVFLRDTEIGAKIGTKNQFIISEGQFLLSKIDARNGAFGVVPAELDGGIITGNFWTFDVDYQRVNPYYLSLVVTTPEFAEFCEQASNGTTNRHYLQEQLFLDIKIPLPGLEEQNELVDAYNTQMALAAEQEALATTLQSDIETYLLNELGVTIKSLDTTKSILQIFSYSDISDRWDLISTHNSIFESLKKSKYSLKEIGKEFNFVSRGWRKQNHKAKVFNYIELGAVDENIGITEASKVNIEKAPSRATQVVCTGDLIIGTTRPYLKKFAIVSDEYNHNICSSGFQIINSEKNNLHFLYEYLKSEAGLLQFKFYMTGALYPAITSKDLKKIKIPLPPIEIQNEIVEHINGLKEQIKTLRTQATENRTTALKTFEQKIFK